MCLVFMAVFFNTGYISMSGGSYSDHPVLCFINALGMILITWEVCKRIDRYQVWGACRKCSLFSVIIEKFVISVKRIGRTSLTYVGLNNLAILLISKCLSYAGVGKVPGKLICLIGTLFIIRGIDKLIRHNHSCF